MNKERIGLLIKVLEESPDPTKFSMVMYGRVDKNGCCTPACVLGHYAHRTDVQESFELYHNSSTYHVRDILPIRHKASGAYVSYYSPYVLEHFGINDTESEALFGKTGCGGARTAQQAIDYLKNAIETGRIE